MGTLTIEQYSAAGSDKQHETPIANLYAQLSITIDSTTSTSAESITLNEDTSYIVVTGAEKHRVSIQDSTAATNYAEIAAGDAGRRDFGVKGGETLYYRLDA